MSQFFELHYHLPEDPARLFDVAQGLAGRRSILKRGGTVKAKPFTETCRRLLFQCIAFAVLTALAAVLVWALHAKLKVLFFLCLVMSLVTFWTYQAGRMGYRKSWTQFREGNRPDGTVTFTASGIREWNASDHTERFKMCIRDSACSIFRHGVEGAAWASSPERGGSRPEPSVSMGKAGIRCLHLGAELGGLLVGADQHIDDHGQRSQSSDKADDVQAAGEGVACLLYTSRCV